MLTQVAPLSGPPETITVLHKSGRRNTIRTIIIYRRVFGRQMVYTSKANAAPLAAPGIT